MNFSDHTAVGHHKERGSALCSAATAWNRSRVSSQSSPGSTDGRAQSGERGEDDGYGHTYVLHNSTVVRSASHVEPRVSAVHKGGAFSAELTGGILLEQVVPISLRLSEGGEGSRRLGLCLRIGRASNPIARVMILRLTDPADPFFLYELELSEEDYGHFKQRLELVVDFNGFPFFLVEMLRGVEDGSLPCHLLFSTQGTDGSRGTLRIVEVTSFRTIEHISLLLVRQGDTGQKKHLAERFQFFEGAYKNCCGELKEYKAEMSRELEEMRAERDSLATQYRSLMEERSLTDTQRDKNHLTVLSEMRNKHDKELKDQLESHAVALKEQQDRFAASQQQILADLRKKDESLQNLQEKYTTVESNFLRLETDYRLLTTKAEVQEEELRSLRDMNNELKQFRLTSIESLNAKDLACATLTEKLNAATAALASKQQELDGLKEQCETQGSCVDLLTNQNGQLSEQIKSLTTDLSKAHYIIRNQLQSITNTKDRYKIAVEQLQTQEQLLAERKKSIDRAKEDLEGAERRAQNVQKKNSELQEQLQKTMEANEVLSKELQQLRDALVQVQKTSIAGGHSLVGRRIFSTPSASRYSQGVFSGSAPTNTDTAPHSPTPLRHSFSGIPGPSSVPGALRFTEPRKVSDTQDPLAADGVPYKNFPNPKALSGKTFFDRSNSEVPQSAYFQNS